MKQKIVKYYSILLLVIALFFTFKSLMGHVAFGHGLGDIIYHPILWLLTLIYLIIFIVNRKKEDWLFITIILFSIPICLILLKATLWRGPEYRWNGEIFYIPCRTEILIENPGKIKKKVLTMCSMDYYSEFTANWNGNEMINIKGEIKVPKKLEKYIDFPIRSVLIQPAYLSRIANDTIITIYRYDTDTLKKNKEYRLSGEFVKIIDKKPVIETRIK